MQCDIIREGWSANLSTPGRNTYTVPYRIIADNDTQEAKEVVETCQVSGSPSTLPLVYANYSYGNSTDYGAFCLGFNINRPNPSKLSLWQVTANYGPLPAGRVVGDNVANPIERPVKYWLEFETVTEQITEAYNMTELPHRAIGELGPIENAAGIEYDEALFEDRNNVILVAQQNYATLDEIYDIHATFDMTLNNDTFKGRPKGHARFMSVECGMIQTENQATYYTGTIRVQLSREPIYRSIVNQGFAYLDGSGGIIEAKDANGDRVSEPQLLDTDGTLLAKGVLGNTIDYRTREFVNYSGLGI